MTDNITFQEAVLQTDTETKPEPLPTEEIYKNKCELLSYQMVQLQKMYDELDSKNKKLERVLEVLYNQLVEYENDDTSEEASQSEEEADKPVSLDLGSSLSPEGLKLASSLCELGSVVLEEKQN